MRNWSYILKPANFNLYFSDLKTKQNILSVYKYKIITSNYSVARLFSRFFEMPLLIYSGHQYLTAVSWYFKAAVSIEGQWWWKWTNPGAILPAPFSAGPWRPDCSRRKTLQDGLQGKCQAQASSHLSVTSAESETKWDEILFFMLFYLLSIG